MTRVQLAELRKFLISRIGGFLGTTLLAAMETQVRNDLKDIDAAAYLWSTAELDRHLQHALNDYQRVVPLIAYVDIVVASTTGGDGNPTTLRQSVGTPAGYLWAERVEYTIDQQPPIYRIFREEIPGGGSLFFPVGDPPLVGKSMRVWYAKAHTLSASVSTLPQEHEEVIALGAVAYAARSGTRYAIGRLNASIWTPKGLAAFATESMKAFRDWLEQLRESYSSSGTPMPQWGSYPSGWSRV